MSKIVYICQNCSYKQSKWTGQCMNCKEWNTFVEEIEEKRPKLKVYEHIDIKPINFQGAVLNEERYKTSINEFDRVLGGGIVKDSFILLTGDPGIGKSTLSLQIAKELVDKTQSVLYISGEESISQIVSRGIRLGMDTNSKFLLINELVLEKIIAIIKQQKPNVVIIDSIQVIYSNDIQSISGSITQIRFAAENLMKIAKENNIAIIIIGHVTKDGNMAGPMVLSHLVDTVLYLEGEKYQQYRILRGLKNRFGTTSEIGIFEMCDKGLKEVINPSASFLKGRLLDGIGSCITSTIEGTRPFLVEIQALTTYTKFGYPKRTSSGIDINRVNLMIAVLNKYCNLKLDSQDIFINIIGGIKVREPAQDLALCLSIASSKIKKSIPGDTIVIGEVGLSGEVRGVSQINNRIRNGLKLGFKRVIMPDIKANIKDMEYIKVKTVNEALKIIQNS